MIKKLRLFYQKSYLISRLMQMYSLLLVGTILLVVAALCVFTGQTNRKNIDNQVEVLTNHLETFAANKENTLSYIYMELIGNYSSLDNLRQFLTLDSTEYFYSSENAWNAFKVDSRIPTIVSPFFYAFPDLETIHVVLDDLPGYYRASQGMPKGEKRNEPLEVPTGFTLQRLIVDPLSFQPIGTLYTTFSTKAALGSFAKFSQKAGVSIFAMDQYNQMVFAQPQMLSSGDQTKVKTALKSGAVLPSELESQSILYQKKAPVGLSYAILVNRGLLMRKNFWIFAIIISVGTLLASTLLIILRQTFTRYLRQVGAIMDVTRAIGAGDLKARVDTCEVQEELYDLATSINFMVASLDQFIKENYDLEIKQRDAHMRALQSQINPHFLYNTLEYIRMYALSRQQEELAEVVYAFSALLRNNTTQEKTTTLEKELSFCEKYVYLHQMRYPDQIAYHFSIADDLKQLVIPKFTIQPLIENYFVHGLNHTHYDNAISVRVTKEGKWVMIRISDNGKGMTAERLAEIRDQIATEEEQISASIGIKNVHERLKSFFGKEGYQMEIRPTYQEQGVTILLKIREEGVRRFV